MKKKEYIEPKVKVVELDSSDIITTSFNNGNQSLSDDERDDVIFE